MKSHSAVESSFTTAQLINMDMLTKEEYRDLFSNARTIDALLKWAPDQVFVKSKRGVTWNATVSYNFEKEGNSFTENCLPDSFRRLKYDMKRHIISNRHKDKYMEISELKKRE